MKRIVSLLLSVVMIFSVISTVDLSACAAEGSTYLSEEDVQFLTSKFSYTLTRSEKAMYADHLKNLNPEIEWSSTDWDIVKYYCDNIQKVWGAAGLLLPDKITENELAKLGNNTLTYIISSIEIFKNIHYISETDGNNIQKAYHGIKVFQNVCNILGWSLGSFGIVLSAVAATLPIANLLYEGNIRESLVFYEAQLQIAYYPNNGVELPTPEEAMMKPAFADFLGKEQYEQGLYSLYTYYSLRLVDDKINDMTFVNPIGEKCNFAGHTYQVFNMSMNWTEAKEYCENLSGHLATITNSDEQDFVYDLVQYAGKDTYWLGATDAEVEGEWKWITGESFEYQNGSFDDGPPGPEDWLEMVASNGRWNDGEHDGDREIYSLQNHGFICEWDNYIDPFPTMNDVHHYSQTVITPTCTTDGYTINRCIDCGLEYYSNNVTKLGHNYNLTKKTAVTCTSQGFDLYTCSRCNSTEKRNITSALGHNYKYQNTIKATCTSEGYDTYKCSRCSITENRNTISAKGHSYSLSGHRDPTCNEAGFNKYTCKVCNNSYQDEISVLNGSALTASLEKARAYLAKDYFTEQSMLNLQTVYDKHKNDLDTLTNQEAVDNAVTEINTAINNLVLGDYASGKTEEGFSWNWERNSGILTVDGSGAMPNYNSSSMPWYDVIPYATQIIVSEDITSIGSYAFYNAKNVQNISLPNTLTTINERAFEHCSSVEILTVPDSVTSIGYAAFANMTVLKKVSVPASTTYRSYCFDKDKAIEEVIITYGINGVIPNSNVTNEQSYFMDKFQKRTGNFGPWKYGDNVTVKISEGVTTVGYNTFWQALGMSSIHIPSTVNQLNLNNGVFYQNFHLTEIIVDEKNQTYCDFNNCLYSKDMTQFLLYPQGSNETKFIMPESVKEIRSYAFYDCNSLKNIKLNEKLNNIGTYAFGHCDNLQYISILNPECNIDSNNYTIMDTATIEGYKGSTAEVYANNHSMNFAEIQKLEIKSISLSLESSITMNFKVLKSAVVDFENPYVVFTCESDELKVTDYTEQGEYYVFSYPGISPQLMNDNVVAVLHADHNGIDYTSPEKIMSVRTYAYTMLNRYSSPIYAKLRTLLVDLLNYGAASQKYVGYQTDNLVNADLTDEQKSWGTSSNPTFENIRNYDYKTIDNPTSEWISSGLILNNSVMVKAKFTTDSIDNKTVVITCGKGKFTYTKDDFVLDKDGNYYVYCDEIFANEMSEEILLTVYDNGVQCSNTMRFSIESYAKLVHDSYKGTALDELTTAMMRYGNSAKAYGA